MRDAAEGAGAARRAARPVPWGEAPSARTFEVRHATTRSVSLSVFPEPFELEVDAGADLTVVDVRGEVDLFTATELTRAVTYAIDRERPLIVDLCGCDFLDSTGLHALVTGAHAARSAGLRFAVACPPAGAPARLLELSLQDALPVHASRAAAAAGLRA